MDEHGLVSIVMPAYNAEKTISQSIESVLGQIYQNWELLIVNDCSTDNTESIVVSYLQDSRIKLINNERNTGVAQSRNTAIESSIGRYIAFLDSDDMWTNTKLISQIEFMVKNDYYFTCTSYEVIDEQGGMTNKYLSVPTVITYESMLRGSKIGCLTVMIDTSVTGKFNMPSIKHEDYVTWLNLIKKFGPAHGLNKMYAYYRVFDGSLSSNKLQTSKWQYQIYREYYGYSFIRSAHYFINYAINGLFKYNKMRTKRERVN